MPAERRFGMDHGHYDWSPINKRGILRWPDNARVALCVIVNLDHPEWDPPADSFTTPFAGGLSARDFPDYARLSIGNTGIGWVFSACWTPCRSTA